MTSINPSQPVGVGGYADQKPQFTQQQQQVFGQDAYNNQSAYAAQQQGYPEAPASPAPQYTPGAAPYSPPISPPPQQAYGNDVKSAYTAPAGNATELGGETKAGAPVAQTTSYPPTAELGGESRQGGVGQTTPHPPAAELGGETRQGGVGQTGPSELSSHK
jgi:hypothetical protein